MWGEVTPAERLRSVTRRLAADDALAAEAADALAGFAAEPASLVVACRRVLAHHPAHGALWWACARILAAPDASLAAEKWCACSTLTAPGIASPRGCRSWTRTEIVAGVGWPRAVDEAMAERQDLPAVAVRVDGADPIAALRRRDTERNVRVVEQWDPVLDDVAYLLVSAAAIGPTTALVPAGVGELLTDFGSSRREVWLVGGVGRVLPSRLFDAAVAASEPSARASRRRRRRPRDLFTRALRPARGPPRRRVAGRCGGAVRLPGGAGAVATAVVTRGRLRRR